MVAISWTQWSPSPGTRTRVRLSVSKDRKKVVLYYLADGEFKKIEAGEFAVARSADDGSMVFSPFDGEEV